MSNYRYEGYGVVRDTEIDFPYHTDDIVELLDEKDEKITNLEAKLAESESKRKILEEKVKWLSEENEECFVDGQKYNELREQKDKEIQDLKQQLAESERKLEEYKKCNCKECMTDYEKNLNQIIDKYLNENIKLKQQLHELPKKIVEEITNELSNNTSLYFEIRESTSSHCPNKEYEWFNYVRFRNYINTILKKYGGKE